MTNDLRKLITARFLFTFAVQMQVVALGWRMYDLTHDALSLGFIGLAEAIPALSLALYAGAIVDRSRPIYIMQWVLTGSFISGLVLFLTQLSHTGFSATQQIAGLYTAAVITGIARSFAQPALFATIPRLIPREQVPKASAWMGSVMQVARIAGPGIGGLIFGWAGISPKQYYAQMFAEQATPLGNPTRGVFRANVKNSAAQADELIQNAEGQIVPSTKMVQNTTMVPQTTSATRIPPPDPGDLAAHARTWMEANAAVQSAAKSHGMDPHELESLVLTDRPSIQDLAAAVQRHGFTPDELNQLREYAPTLRGADLPAATTTSQTSMVPKTTTTAKPVMIPKNNVTPAAVAGRAKGAGSLEDLKFGEDPARDIQQAHDVIDNWAAQQPERIPLTDIQRGKQQLSKRIQELYTTAATGGDNAVAAGPSRKAAIKALADAERSILEETVSGLQEANKRTQNAMAMRMIASKRADVTGPSPSFTSKNLIGPAGPLLWQGLESPAALSRYGIALGRPGVQQGLSMVPGALSGGGSLLTSPRNAVYPDSLSPTRGR